MSYTAKELAIAHKIIRDHYRPKRPLSTAEVQEELFNLTRKRAAGILDDSSAMLCARLINAGVLPQ